MSQTPLHPEALADRQADRKTWVVILMLILASWIVLSSSEYDELSRNGHQPGLEPWLREVGSHIASLVCFLIVPLMLNRWPVTQQNWVRTLPMHILATIAFSICHTLLMIGIRKLTYPPILGQDYHFGMMDPSIWVYEYRKDAYSYLIGLLAFATSRMLEQRRLEAQSAQEDARSKGRLTLRSGGRTIFLDADSVLFAKAASNYVEVTTPSKTHLARMTLSNLENLFEEAGTDHIRVHRSYLVNKHHIQEITPTGDGNVTIHLDTGAEIPGSRSYREQLANALPA